MKTDFLVPGKIEKWADKWPLIRKLLNSEYGAILDSAYEKLDPSILYNSITHGRGHIERTMLFGALVCMNEAVDTELAKDVVCCCALHDIGRIDDRYDEHHGESSANKLVTLGLDKCFRYPAEARAAIHAHSAPDRRMSEAPSIYGAENNKVFQTLACCLKDADNLDRVRIFDLDESFLRHESTRKMVPLAYYVLNEFNHVTTVLCYGDSNTYGYNPVTGGRYPVHMRWPNALQEMLGCNYDVISEGMNGRTALFYDVSDDAGKIEEILLSHYPLDWIVFMLGTNDCLPQYGLSAAEIASGMEKLVTHSKRYLNNLQGFEAEIIIIAPKSLDEIIIRTIPDNRIAASVETSRKLPELYSAIAEKLGCRFLSLENVLELSPADGIHLQAFGGRKIAQRVAEIILGNP